MMCVSCLIVLYVRHSVNEPFGDTRKIRVTRTITFTCIVISGENAWCDVNISSDSSTHYSACVNFMRIFIGLVIKHKRPYPFWSFEKSSSHK